MTTPTHLYDAYIFDLDGTIFLGEALLPTVAETIAALRAAERRVIFLSNNPTQTGATFAAKLARLGLETAVSDILNSTAVMVDFLRQTLPGARLFVVGEEPLRAELAAGGFTLTTDAAQVDAVIVGFDRTFDYAKLQIAFDAIRGGARFFATNADRYCPVPGGGQPDAAALIAAIEACTDTKVEAVVGKPSRFMAAAALRLAGAPPERCLMTGDRLETDVLMGLQAGMDAALVLTGATAVPPPPQRAHPAHLRAAQLKRVASRRGCCAEFMTRNEWTRSRELAVVLPCPHLQDIEDFMTIHTPDWVKNAIFYQIFPDRFARGSREMRLRGVQLKPWGSPPQEQGYQGGDLYGVVDRLDYLQDLGVTALYLNPIFASASNHRYHTYDYYEVDPLLGGDDALRELLDAAHGRSMRVVLDGVFNHASRGFWAFHHILENGPNSPYIDWFFVNDWPLRPYNYDAQNPHNYTAWWNLPALPKFNTDNPGVRDYLLGVARHWIDFGIDGWRLDVPDEIDDDDFWQEFRATVKEGNPDAYIVGEIWTPAQRWLQGDQFDAVMNYQFTVPVLTYTAAHTLRLDYEKSEYDLTAVLCPPIRPGDRHHARPLRLGDQPGPAQPARQPRHRPRPVDHGRRPERPAPGRAAANDHARRALHLLRRRNRPFLRR